MDRTEQLFQEFVDAIQTATDNSDFERIASRAAHGLGFRWFAYLCLADGAQKLISSYPKSWTDRYFRRRYHGLDPVVHRARAEHNVFSWGADSSTPQTNKEHRRFFEEATTFGIKSGVTVPIRGGFGRMAAFTLATDDALMQPEKLLSGSGDVVHLLGLYFHIHVFGRLLAAPDATESAGNLSQRERQCLAWAARGKTISDTAALVRISPRTVAFHLENARQKLGAVSIAHCVALAFCRGLLP